MKTYLVSILLLSLSVRVVAQHLEFGLNGGMVSNSIQNVNANGNYENYNAFQSTVTTTVVSAMALYNMGHYQYGAVVGYNSCTYKGVTYPDLPPGIMPYPSVQYKDREEPVKLLANRLFRFKRLVAYGGVAAQYIFSRTTGSIVSPGWAEPVAPPDKSDNRLAADLHVGATYYVTRHIGINAEVAATYNNLPSDSPFSGNVFSYPVTLGVRYRLSEP